MRSTRFGLLLAALVPALLLVGCPPAENTLPEVGFRASETSGFPPLVVRFTDESKPFSSPIVGYRWDFGDGETSTDQNPQHTYIQPGFYTVKLTVISADGQATAEQTNLIEVRQSSQFAALTPAGGAVANLGVRFEAPAGAVDSEVAFGFRRDDITFERPAEEDLLLLSAPVRVTHNNADTEFFASELGDTLQPSELTLAFDPLGAGDGPIDSDHVFIYAQDPTTRKTVPIPGMIEDRTISADVSGLPSSAIYVVAFRPTGMSDTFSVSKVNVPTNFSWADSWRFVYSETQADQLSALRLASIRQPTSFSRRGFDDANDDISIAIIEEAVERISETFAESGLRRPRLIDEDGHYTVLLSNFFPTYDSSIDSVEDLPVFDNTFGYCVIDPLQLLTISARNASEFIRGDGFENFEQIYTAQNALAQGIVSACLDGYEYPPITNTMGSETVRFLEGLRRGSLTYIGQTFSGRVSARSFGPNEKLLLDESLLAPLSDDIEGYAFAGQDFFTYLRNRYAAEDEPYRFLVESIPPDLGVYEAVRFQVEALLDTVEEPTFDEALLAAAAALDDALRGVLDISLAQAYSEFAQDIAFELNQEAILRPTDDALPMQEFNPTVFSADGVIEQEFLAPADTIAMTAMEFPQLGAVSPLSTQAVSFGVSELTTEVLLTFDTSAWAEDADGNSVIVTALVPGQEPFVLGETEDTLLVSGFTAQDEDCLDELVVMASNVSLAGPNPVEFTAQALSGLVVPETQVLDQYLAACDPGFGYTYDSVSTVPGTGSRLYNLTMNSGAWRGDEDVDGGVWSHPLSIIEPSSVIGETALLFITGGTPGSIPVNELAVLGELAESSNTIVAVLSAVPNQPLQFTDETMTRTEDQILAYSFDEYLTSAENNLTDKTWPALLPMTRAAVQAMDTVQEFFSSGNISQTIRRFVVSGASKRGWTTWLTAAADNRVTAIIPIVADVLNLDEQMDNQFRSYGFFAPALQPYTDENVFTRLGTPEGQSLLSIIDPITYVKQLTMPKFIANSTGDQFFLPNSLDFYLDELTGESRVYFAPNTNHGLTSGTLLRLDENTVNSIFAWYLAFVKGVPRPRFDVTLLGDNQILVNTDTTPTRVLLWQATNPNARDFRLESFGPNWQSTELTSTNNSYTAIVDTPEEGWTAFFIQAFFPGPDPALDIPFGFSTPVQIVPDLYPDELP